MKKSVLFFILLLFLIICAVPLSYAQDTYPSGTFKLTHPRIKGQNPVDPSVFSISMEQVLHIGEISISENKLSADATVPIGFVLKDLNQEFKGEGKIQIEGEYYKESGYMTGTFTYIDNVEGIKTFIDSPLAPQHSYGDINYSGNFKGAVVGGRGGIVFNGRFIGKSKSQIADGSYKDYSTDEIYTTRVIYDVTLPYKKEEEPTYQTTEKVEGEGEDSGVRFSGISGKIEWKLATDPPDAWVAGHMDDKLPYGAMIRTKEESTAVLGFPDMSTFTLKPDSTIILAGKPGPESKLKLVAGNIWTNIKKMVKDGSMEIDTSQAVAGIKGTIFEMNEENGITTLKVYRGTVSFKSVKGGETVDVNEGEEISADSAGLSEKKFFDSASELQVWADLTVKTQELDDIKIPEQPAEQTTFDSSPSSTPENISDLNFYLLPGGIGAIAVLIIVVVIKVIKKKA